MTGRPVPVPDELSAPFWENCAKHVLTLPRCSRCRAFSFPPDVVCAKCRSPDPRFEFVPVPGRGRVRTWTVVRHSFLSGFETPYILVDVEFDDPPAIRMIGRLLDGPDAGVALEAPVTVAFEDIRPGVAVPAFRMAQDQ